MSSLFPPLVYLDLFSCAYNPLFILTINGLDPPVVVGIRWDAGRGLRILDSSNYNTDKSLGSN